MLEDVPFLASMMQEVRAKYPDLEPARFANEIMRRQITHMVEDVISVAQQRLLDLKPQSVTDIRAADHAIATFSEAMAENRPCDQEAVVFSYLPPSRDHADSCRSRTDRDGPFRCLHG